MGSTRSVYSVTQLNSYIKNMFAQDFMLNAISIRGELSNVKYHSSGHIYFTLKDGKSSVSCVMFAGNRKGLGCQLLEGLQVVVKGSVEVYERDGKYQLYAKEITKDGIGALYERFLAMKKEMEEMGMFALEYKRPIPFYVKRLGVVTAPTGAAVRDIINIAKRRNPYIEIILYPALVQGEGAKESIVKGIHALEKIGVDVMIVGRGGGSMEDLWAFNEEMVAQAIFDCSVPVISAVGHETDFTIADYVADLRAPTPSAAAELAVFEYFLIEERLRTINEQLLRRIEHKIRLKRMELTEKQNRLKLLSPRGQLTEKRMRLMQLEEAFDEAMKHKLLKRRHRLELFIEGYKGASPLNKLSKGYSYIQNSTGNCIKKASQLTIGEELSIQLYEGSLKAIVTEVREEQ